MSGNFNTYIDHIDFDAWRDVCVTKGKLKHFARGEEFVTIGNVGHYFGFIQSGTLKYVAISDDGTEHVIAFVFGEGFVVDWRNFLQGKKANVSIVATSDCDIYCLSIKEIKAMMAYDPYFGNMVTRTTEALYGTIYDRHIDLYVKTPQQRYNELISRYPDLFDLFSLRDIASFLNITPTHLSRLRKKDRKQC